MFASSKPLWQSGLCVPCLFLHWLDGASGLTARTPPLLPHCSTAEPAVQRPASRTSSPTPAAKPPTAGAHALPLHAQTPLPESSAKQWSPPGPEPPQHEPAAPSAPSAASKGPIRGNFQDWPGLGHISTDHGQMSSSTLTWFFFTCWCTLWRLFP